VIHGGPAWASFSIFSDCFNEKYPIEQFIEKGFIVLEPNYWGSSGYGIVNVSSQENYQEFLEEYITFHLINVEPKIQELVAAKTKKLGRNSNEKS